MIFQPQIDWTFSCNVDAKNAEKDHFDSASSYKGISEAKLFWIRIYLSELGLGVNVIYWAQTAFFSKLGQEWTFSGLGLNSFQKTLFGRFGGTYCTVIAKSQPFKRSFYQENSTIVCTLKSTVFRIRKKRQQRNRSSDWGLQKVLAHSVLLCWNSAQLEQKWPVL